MHRLNTLIAALWASRVYGQLLTSVSTGIGDDSLTFNCGSSFDQTNAVCNAVC